eukprot:14039063-Alexandrium_andersonii.AAC.1
MSASLVGSEMCIRDRVCRGRGTTWCRGGLVALAHLGSLGEGIVWRSVEVGRAPLRASSDT